ncbi:MAG TPA: hypothetical protein VLF60_03925 [Candidatus Saccharimonadales bacterium]|nr:hypothetical protein [Candidatus Saccharimonadales bacterium]
MSEHTNNQNTNLPHLLRREGISHKEALVRTGLVALAAAALSHTVSGNETSAPEKMSQSAENDHAREVIGGKLFLDGAIQKVTLNDNGRTNEDGSQNVTVKVALTDNPEAKRLEKLHALNDDPVFWGGAQSPNAITVPIFKGQLALSKDPQTGQMPVPKIFTSMYGGIPVEGRGLRTINPREFVLNPQPEAGEEDALFITSGATANGKRTRSALFVGVVASVKKDGKIQWVSKPTPQGLELPPASETRPEQEQ